MMKTTARCRSILALFIFIAAFVFCDIARADIIYWVDVSSGEIRRADLEAGLPVDGSTAQILVSGLNLPRDLAIDAAEDKIYWGEREPARAIRRADKDTTGQSPGNGVEEIVTGLSLPSGIHLDLRAGERKVYFTDLAGKVQRADMNTTGQSPGFGVDDLVISQINPYDVAIDATVNKIYWVELGLEFTDDGKVKRRDSDGGGIIETIVSGLTDPISIALDVANGKVYWADFNAGKIQRADMNTTGQSPAGFGVDDIVTGLGTNSALGIALDLRAGEDKVYFTDVSTGKIQKADMNTTGQSPVTFGVTDVVTGLGIPYGIALELDQAEQGVIPELPPGVFGALGFMMSGLLFWMRRRFSG